MRHADGAAAAPEALLLTGPLGAGKTTLLDRSILPALAGRRVVVLVNDAGVTPLDSLLLSETAVPTFGVAGGCFCCQAGGQLLEALARIRDALAPELLIVEGSGVSPPGPIAAALQSEGYRLVGTIGVVAASQIERLSRDPLPRAQLAAAGIVVVSGADRLDRPGFDSARRALAGIARGAVLPAFEGRVNAPLAAWLSPGFGDPSGGDGSLHAHVRTIRLEPEGLPRRRELVAWLAAAPTEVLRVKGLVQCAEHACAIAVNHALGETDLRPIPGTAEPTGLWIVHEEAAPHTWLAALPPGLDPADWATLGPLVEPLGAFDGRIGAAFCDGRRVDGLVAAERFLERLDAARRPRLVTADPAVARLWQPRVASLHLLADARLSTLDGALREETYDLLLLTGLPDGVAERLAREAGRGPILHLSRRRALAAASVSLRVEPDQERTLATLAAATSSPAAG
ncbi:MAG: hypothetical protein KatS3mg117_0765 [Geminicoccaceae bacterium]|nr:MAG: hypothetical protein KatS3mg117_0765 [Geminicoccaceae bacterium]